MEKELTETQKKLDSCRKDSSGSSTEDPLDAFMTSVRSEAAMDGVERRKLHVHVADLRKEAQRLRKLVELTRPVQLPTLLPNSGSESEKPKKSLPLFGAMKGGSKFKLKTGTIGKLPPKRPNLPAELFNMKEVPPGGEEEEEDEDEDKHKMKDSDDDNNDDKGCERMAEPEEEEETSTSVTEKTEDKYRQEEATQKLRLKEPKSKLEQDVAPTKAVEKVHNRPMNKDTSLPTGSESKAEGNEEPGAESIPKKKKKGPSRPPVPLTGGQYPDDDPDYCVWLPPVGQTGDGRTHLNDKYGY